MTRTAEVSFPHPTTVTLSTRRMLISPPGVLLRVRDPPLRSCAVRSADGGDQSSGPGRSAPGFPKQRWFHCPAQSCLGSQSCWAAGEKCTSTQRPQTGIKSTQRELKNGSHAAFCVERLWNCASLLFFQVLLSLGASPNYKDRCGLTPLYHTVLAGGDTSCCETLLYYRATLGTRDENGWDESHQVPSIF